MKCQLQHMPSGFAVPQRLWLGIFWPKRPPKSPFLGPNSMRRKWQKTRYGCMIVTYNFFALFSFDCVLISTNFTLNEFITPWKLRYFTTYRDFFWKKEKQKCVEFGNSVQYFLSPKVHFMIDPYLPNAKPNLELLRYLLWPWSTACIKIMFIQMTNIGFNYN